MMIRRYVNVVSESVRSRVYSLHRVDVSNLLFYTSRAEAQAAAEAAGKNTRLPKLSALPAPAISFRSSPNNSWINSRLESCGLLSPDFSDGRVLFTNSLGHAFLYESDSRSCSALPSLSQSKGQRPIAVSVTRPGSPLEQDLYVMRATPMPYFRSNGFEVLKFGACDDDSALVSPWHANASWCWESLPPPPFIDGLDCEAGIIISSHTVAEGGRTICFSSASPGVGTHCFDTVKREWRRAGDWLLPFDGEALYVPELGHWLGFSTGYVKNLCAVSNLDSALGETGGEKAPQVQYTWPDLARPEQWCCIGLHLLNLGSGRFCTARIFRVMGQDELEEVDHDFALLTGVELIISSDEPDGRIEMVRHKTVRYRFTTNSIRWVL